MGSDISGAAGHKPGHDTSLGVTHEAGAGIWQAGRVSISFSRGLPARLLRDERVRFVIVGVVNTVVAYALFVVFELAFGGRYFLSLGLSYLFATLLAFALHRRYTFGVSGRDRLVTDFLRFESVYVVMLAINAALLPALVEGAGWPTLVAQAVCVVVTTVTSYLGHRFFSFRHSRRR